MDGAWWPYGRDLAVEVLDLVQHFPPMLGRLSRVVYSAPDWALNRRRRIQADEVFVSIGSFPRDDAHMVMLRSVSPRVSRVLQLLVVPPEWDERAARHAMRAAAGPGNTASGAALLDESRISCSPVSCRTTTPTAQSTADVDRRAAPLRRVVDVGSELAARSVTPPSAVPTTARGRRDVQWRPPR